MTLRRKFWLWSTVLIAGVLILGAVSVWNLVALRRAARAAVAEYDAMDRAQATAVRVAWLRDVLRLPDARNYRDPNFITTIQTDLMEIQANLRRASATPDGDLDAENAHARSAADHLDAAGKKIRVAGAGAAEASDLAAAANELEVSRQSLLALANMVPMSARHHVTGAADRLLDRLMWTCIWLAIVLCLSALVHLVQYRTLVRPLLWLRDEMRRSAKREYKDEIRPPPARADAAEFREVATAFNGLTRDLAELYRTLDEKVIARSRELVRSERLASVGFLAAGVAHEINNPLSVIAGYAEMAAKSLKRLLTSESTSSGSEAQLEAEAEALSGALDAQTVIHEEAFRCKEITSRLLSLSRGGKDAREPVRLDELARQVTVLTRGLKNYRDRTVVLDVEAGESLEVLANPTEMKQVLLNLTINALEATPPQRGQVRIVAHRDGADWIEIEVQDNGKGMTAQTVQNVFEQFFTDKRGAGEPGTGLGLSITHAIVESHGGRISAESDGPGRGSRFIVRLPALKKQLSDSGVVASATTSTR
jgi:two-component system, NtrC family, sensor kinase